jgi:ubiquinone/menaquinone biosynthesis C-methylase UbiE
MRGVPALARVLRQGTIAAVKHADHVALIRAGVEGGGTRWLELGAGDGEFTLALADCLGGTGDIVAVDRDKGALADLAGPLDQRFPDTTLEIVEADFTLDLPRGPFDGVLAANSLHFVRHQAPFLRQVHDVLRPGGRLVLVEYDAESGNPWVPHPISFRAWGGLARGAGFAEPRLIHAVPSRFLGSIYGAVTERAGP